MAVLAGVFYAFAVYFLNGSGAIPLVAAVLPSEALPDHLKAKGIGLITAVGEIVGGVLVPAVAGVLSDQFAPAAFLWVSSALGALGLFFISRLK